MKRWAGAGLDFVQGRFSGLEPSDLSPGLTFMMDRPTCPSLRLWRQLDSAPGGRCSQPLIASIGLLVEMGWIGKQTLLAEVGVMR